ncbi:MAG: Bug family tripartite tricarboxylate transporter substrate binding protein [Ignavibacteriales bacterium]
MSVFTRRRVLAALVCISVVLIASGCGGQQKVKYPERTINLIVGWAAGGPTDVIARAVAPALQKKLGQPVILTNTPGAAGSVGAENVSKQAPDGYTLLFGSETMSTWNVMGVTTLNYKKDFVPVGVVAEAVPCVIVPSDSPYKDLKQLVDDARARPETIKCSTAGPGTVPHVCGLMIGKVLGPKFSFIPFQGGIAAITAVLSKQTDMTIEMMQSIAPHYKGGKVRVLATFTNERLKQLPEVPALGELYPEMKNLLPYGPWFGLLAPKGTPAEVTQKLATTLDSVLKEQEWQTSADNMYVRTLGITDSAKVVEYLDKWTSVTSWLLYDLGIAKESPEKYGIAKP